MKREETKKFMRRIKEHYEDFIVDDGKIEEWHNWLKDYAYDDVSHKLDEHLLSEQYGQYIPKVAFLIKYLTKEKEKGNNVDYKVQCFYCKQYLRNSEFQEHFKRCSSINYMNNQRKRFFGKTFDDVAIKQLWGLDEESFRKKYREMLEIVKKETDDEDERQRIEAILDNHSFKFQTSFVKEV